MKFFYLAIILLLQNGILFAQCEIPNFDFENWVQGGGYKDPEQWGTLNFVVTNSVSQATGADAFKGMYSCKLKTIDFGFQVAPGIAVTGAINIISQNATGGFACNQRPAYFKGWHKYLPQGNDSSSMAVSLTHWDTTTKQQILVGTAEFVQKNTVSEYQHFYTAINYLNNLEPDTALIVLLSSIGEAATPNSTLFVDELSLSNDVDLVIDKRQINQVQVFPNICKQQISFNQLPKNSTIEIINNCGIVIYKTSSLYSNNTISTSSLPFGLYFYRIVDDKKQTLQTGKFIISR